MLSNYTTVQLPASTVTIEGPTETKEIGGLTITSTITDEATDGGASLILVPIVSSIIILTYIHKKKN